jgi:hypothetical protein
MSSTGTRVGTCRAPQEDMSRWPRRKERIRLATAHAEQTLANTARKRRGIIATSWIAGAAVAVALLSVGRVGAQARDPLFGATTAAPLVTGAGGTSAFLDGLRVLEAELLTRRYGPLAIAPGLQAPAASEHRRDVAAHGDHRVRFFRGLQVRQLGSPRSLLGESSPTDGTLGVLPGTLLAARFGIAGYGVGGYALLGGGTFKVFEHGAEPNDVQRNEVVDSTRVFGFVGAGAELRVHRWLVGAFEITYGRLEGRANGGVVAPDPNDGVRTAVIALRIQY